MNLHDRYMAMATAAAAALVLASQPRVAAGEEVGNFTWKGDLRFRFESIDQQYAPDRNRLRIRARAGFVARVNDTVRSEFALATTEGNDSRGSVLRVAFAPARNWVVSATYYLNDTNVDVPATVPNVVDPVRRRDYRRLQLDLNFRY